MSDFPCQQSRSEHISGVPICYHKRAQNGPGIAVVEHRPGPDLSASLDYTEEH
jgi:hypothetical protein